MGKDEGNKERMERIKRLFRAHGCEEQGKLVFDGLTRIFDDAELRKDNEVLLKKIGNVCRDGEELAGLIEGYLNEVAEHALRGSGKYYSAIDVLEWLTLLREKCAILNDGLTGEIKE